MTNSENHPAFFSFPRYDEHKPQSVSNWERGETVPDPDTLAEIFDGSVEALIHRGHCAGRYRRRATVARMGEAIGCIHRMHDLMGTDNFLYRTMASALDERMGSEIEAAFANPRIMDAHICKRCLPAPATVMLGRTSTMRR